MRRFESSAKKALPARHARTTSIIQHAAVKSAGSLARHFYDRTHEAEHTPGLSSQHTDLSDQPQLRKWLLTYTYFLTYSHA